MWGFALFLCHLPATRYPPRVEVNYLNMKYKIYHMTSQPRITTRWFDFIYLCLKCVCRGPFKGIVWVFLKWGHTKYISIVGLFPSVIADQRSLSLEKQRATQAQMLSFVLHWMESRCKANFNHLKQGPPKKNDISSTLFSHCILPLTDHPSESGSASGEIQCEAQLC